MGKFLICLYGLAILCWGVMITFKIMKHLKQRIKNDTLNRWFTPLISGLFGGYCITVVLLVSTWIYSNVGFLREFLSAIDNLL